MKFSKQYIVPIILLVAVAVVLVIIVMSGRSNDTTTEPVETTPKEVRTVSSIQAVDDLTDIVYSGSKNLFYITSFDERKVYVVNAENTVIEGEIPLDYPYKMVLSSNEEVMYVSAGAQRVYEVSMQTFEVLHSVKVNSRPTEMALHQNGQYLFVVNEYSDELTVIDTNDFTIVKVIPVGRRPMDVVVDRSGEYVYVANKEEASLTKISADSLSVVGVIPNVGKPVALLSYPFKDLILVLDQYNDQVVVVDESANEVAVRIDGVDYATDMVLDEDSKRVYVTSFTQNSIGIINLDTESLVEVVRLGSAFEVVAGLNNVLYIPKSKSLIVTNTNTGQVLFVPVN